jgi:hypothetical protein
VFAPNHPLRPAVTAVAIGNIGKQRDAKTGEHDRVSDAAGMAAVIRLELLMQSLITTTYRGLPGRSCWHGWVRSFRWRVQTVAAISG